VPEEAVTEEFDDDQPRPEISIYPEQVAGVWANWAHVASSNHEFTLEFVRIDPFEPRGIVLARVSFSPLFVTQLIDALSAVWQTWVQKALPPEVNR